MRITMKKMCPGWHHYVTSNNKSPVLSQSKDIKIGKLPSLSVVDRRGQLNGKKI